MPAGTAICSISLAPGSTSYLRSQEKRAVPNIFVHTDAFARHVYYTEEEEEEGQWARGLSGTLKIWTAIFITRVCRLPPQRESVLKGTPTIVPGTARDAETCAVCATSPSVGGAGELRCRGQPARHVRRN